MVKITLDSKNVTKNDLISFESFLEDVSSITDLLLLTKLCENECGERIETMYETKMGITEIEKVEK